MQQTPAAVPALHPAHAAWKAEADMDAMMSGFVLSAAVLSTVMVVTQVVLALVR